MNELSPIVKRRGRRLEPALQVRKGRGDGRRPLPLLLRLCRGRGGRRSRRVLHEGRVVEEAAGRARAAGLPGGCRGGRRRRQHGAEVLVDEGGRLG